MTQLDTSIDINASADRVWEILIDFPAYPLWNPFITSISGEIKAGETVTMHLTLPGKPAMSFKPRIKVVIPPRELRWAGYVLAPGLLDGEHSFEIQGLTANRCLLRHVEVLTGVLAPLFIPTLQDATKNGFVAMNQALKNRAEGTASGQKIQ